MIVRAGETRLFHAPRCRLSNDIGSYELPAALNRCFMIHRLWVADLRGRSPRRSASQPLGLEGCHSITEELRIFDNGVVLIDGRRGVDGGSAETLIAELVSLRDSSIED